MNDDLLKTEDGRWASQDTRDGFIYDYEKIGRETGYTVAQVKMYGVSYCRRNPILCARHGKPINPLSGHPTYALSDGASGYCQICNVGHPIMPIKGR